MNTAPATVPSTVRTFATRDEWLAYRKESKRIGASECASALGEGYDSPLALWGKKTGKVADTIETARMRIGTLSEANALEVFNVLNESKGLSAQSAARFWTTDSLVCESAAYPWMAATPDAITYEPTDTLGLLEIKCPGAEKFHEWRSEPPQPYVLQVWHQWIVCREAVEGLAKLRLAAWFGGSDLVEHEIPLPDQDTIDWIVRTEQRLYERILSGDPPPPDGSKSSTDALRSIYGSPKPATQVEIPETMARRYFAARAQRERYEREENEAAGDVMAALQDNEEGTLGGSKLFQWKETTYRYQAKAAYEQTRRVFQPARNWKKLAHSLLGVDVAGPNED